MIGDKGYDSSYFDGRGPEQKDWIMFTQWIETVGLKPGARLFDHGCGTGKFVHIAKSNGLSAFGYEPNIKEENVYGLAKGFVSNGNCIADPEPTNDLVLCIDVMEHLSNEQEVDATLTMLNIQGAEWFIFS